MRLAHRIVVSHSRSAHSAVARLDPDTRDSPHGRGGWYPSERLTRAQALTGFTKEAAFASFSEAQSGSLAVGKRADLVVVDRNIMEVEADEILGTRVLETWMDGVLVYRLASSEPASS